MPRSLTPSTIQNVLLLTLWMKSRFQFRPWPVVSAALGVLQTGLKSNSLMSGIQNYGHRPLIRQS
jgi:hypothetical protein